MASQNSKPSSGNSLGLLIALAVLMCAGFISLFMMVQLRFEDTAKSLAAVSQKLNILDSKVARVTASALAISASKNTEQVTSTSFVPYSNGDISFMYPLSWFVKKHNDSISISDRDGVIQFGGAMDNSYLETGEKSYDSGMQVTIFKTEFQPTSKDLKATLLKSLNDDEEKPYFVASSNPNVLNVEYAGDCGGVGCYPWVSFFIGKHAVYGIGAIWQGVSPEETSFASRISNSLQETK